MYQHLFTVTLRVLFTAIWRWRMNVCFQQRAFLDGPVTGLWSVFFQHHYMSFQHCRLYYTISAAVWKNFDFSTTVTDLSERIQCIICFIDNKGVCHQLDYLPLVSAFSCLHVHLRHELQVGHFHCPIHLMK